MEDPVIKEILSYYIPPGYTGVKRRTFYDRSSKSTMSESRNGILSTPDNQTHKISTSRSLAKPSSDWTSTYRLNEQRRQDAFTQQKDSETYRPPGYTGIFFNYSIND